jgi:hypothetical protein
MQEHLGHVLLFAVPTLALVVVGILRRLPAARVRTLFQALILVSAIPHLAPHIDVVALLSGHGNTIPLCCIAAQATDPETGPRITRNQFAIQNILATPVDALQEILLDAPRIRSPPLA